jgi:hypothetical protein
MTAQGFNVEMKNLARGSRHSVRDGGPSRSLWRGSRNLHRQLRGRFSLLLSIEMQREQ